MKLAIVAVGALRGPGFREAYDEYVGRLRRYAEVTEREVKEAGRIPALAARQAEEARRLREALPPRARIVALDRAGAPWPSEGLAQRLA
ncbi:MAG TPA: 23S rRNA (pseudouridine(1915)-N(3))-methyltransferase RlmH, partial [Gemmatimonadales bacterium]|nr:23S rRNA (pseudouridine(1915)-N(3))-methyltransferase RlmH [Gemmatimonadales bacterium]